MRLASKLSQYAIVFMLSSLEGQTAHAYFDSCWEMFLSYIRDQPIGRAELDAAVYFSHALKNQNQIVKSLDRSSNYIDADIKARDLKLSNFGMETGESGATNVQVLEVRIKSGATAVLKSILENEYSELEDSKGQRIEFHGDTNNHLAFKENMIIQHTLGKLGLAPQFYGFVLPTSMASLARDFRDAGNIEVSLGYQKRVVGLVSEYIDGGWNFVRSAKGSGRIPQWLREWPIEKIDQVLKRLIRIEGFLNALRIFPDDTQLLLQKSGRVLLFDFDFYRFNPMDFPNRFLKFETNKLVALWETSTGNQYPASRFLSVTGHAKITIKD